MNSVAPHERLIIQKEDGETEVIVIGNWIDDLLSKNRDKIQHFEHNKTEYLELENPVWNPTPTKNGVFNWDKVTAVTRHLPGSNFLIKVTTKSGREVTVTKSKSLLIWKNEELVDISGSEAKIGDLVPIICEFPTPNIVIDHLNLRKYLSPKEWV